MKSFNFNTFFHGILYLGVASALTLTAQTVTAADFPAKGDATRGIKLWADNCTRCHNMRSPSDLTDEQWITSVFHMRARAGLTGQEARDIITFLQAANGQASSPSAKPTPVRYEIVRDTLTMPDGKQVYETSCVACHGANGRGALPGVADFTAADGPLSKSDQELLNNIVNGYQSPGSPMPMPARGGNPQLTDADISAALEHIKDQFKP